MADQQLLTLIRVQLQNGVSKEGMRRALHVGGYSDAQIDEAFALLSAAPEAPVSDPAPSAKELLPHPAASIVPPPRMRAPLPAALHRGRNRVLASFSAIALVAMLGGGVAYAYLMDLGPFSHPPYTQSDLISGLLAASSRITSSTYKVSASLTMGPRDPGAAPFTYQPSNQAALDAEYKNDSERMNSISEILIQLKLAQLRRGGSYPASLQSIAAPIKAVPRASVSIDDPKTGEPYSYHAVGGGKNFSLSVTFETPDAISQVRRFSSISGGVMKAPAISGQTVTFTKDSAIFLAMPSTPPKPLIETLSDMVRFLPPSMSASVAMGAAADWTNTAGGFTFNVEGSGDFGDLTYKISVDLLKKGDTYYFRINNLPDLFGGTISALKGKWVMVSASSSAATSTDFVSMVASQLPRQEQQYKQDRAAYVALLRTAASIADRDGVVQVVGAPYAEIVSGESLYHYDLSINKDAIVPFYQQVIDAASSTAAGATVFADPGTLQYLESSDFSQVFDYLEANTKLTLWTDGVGNPRILAYTMRLVPPDTATQLKDRQANLTLELDISGINQPVTITAPSGAIPLSDAQKDAGAIAVPQGL